MIEDFVNKIHVGHVLDILRILPSNSIDVVCTSPPYWGLRDYGEATNVIWGGEFNCKHEWNANIQKPKGGKGDNSIVSANKNNFANMRDHDVITNQCIKCGAWNGQLGLEPHPQMYINHIVEIMREVRRVLKDTGTLWLNIGDSYYGSGKGIGGDPDKSKEIYQLPKKNKPKYDYDGKWLQPKQQLMIPERIAIAMQEDGWIKRNTVIWYKPNAMPSSVKDRLNTTYESIFMFSKSRKYYFDLDSIRVPHKFPEDVKRRIRQDRKDGINPFAKDSKDIKWRRDLKESSIAESLSSPRARTARKGYDAEKHFYHLKGKNPGDTWIINTKPFKGAHFAVYPTTLIERILKCAVPREGIVLDTFIGSGTTGLVAKQLGLNWIGIELNEKYAKEIAIPRIEAGSVELYDVNRCEIPKSISKEPIVNNSIPTGKNPKCPFTVECTFRANELCYMNPKKRVKYCPKLEVK